jgi:hypothetical protein
MDRTPAYAALAAATFCLVGCGGSDVSTVPVSGTVTLEGKPLVGAQISFSPVSTNAQATPGTDITGSSGYYKVMTANGRSGVAPGKYKVVISKTALPPGSASSDADPFMAVLSAEAKTQGGPEQQSPKIQGSFDREVSTRGETFDFDLKLPVVVEPESETYDPAAKHKGAIAKGSKPGARLGSNPKKGR